MTSIVILSVEVDDLVGDGGADVGNSVERQQGALPTLRGRRKLIAPRNVSARIDVLPPVQRRDRGCKRSQREHRIELRQCETSGRRRRRLHLRRRARARDRLRRDWTRPARARAVARQHAGPRHRQRWAPRLSAPSVAQQRAGPRAEGGRPRAMAGRLVARRRRMPAAMEQARRALAARRSPEPAAWRRCRHALAFRRRRGLGHDEFERQQLVRDTRPGFLEQPLERRKKLGVVGRAVLAARTKLGLDLRQHLPRRQKPIDLDVCAVDARCRIRDQSHHQRPPDSRIGEQLARGQSHRVEQVPPAKRGCRCRCGANPASGSRRERRGHSARTAFVETG